MPTPGYDPTRQYPIEVADVEYRRDGDEVYLARVYRPQGPGPFPALMDIHGGQWRHGAREGCGPISEALAASGLVVFAPEFRRATPETPYPAAVVDVNYATRWFKAHAAQFNATAEALGGLGGSSGGHLVMLSAMRPRDPRYGALPLPEGPNVDASLAYLVTVWPILDPHGRYLFAKETGRADIEESTHIFFQPWEAVYEGNPQQILERGEMVERPPTLIIQGDADLNVTPALQERFVAAYRAAGGEATLHVFPDQPHQFALKPGPHTAPAHELIKGFIARQLAALAPVG
jgi:acetyl esterase